MSGYAAAGPASAAITNKELSAALELEAGRPHVRAVLLCIAVAPWWESFKINEACHQAFLVCSTLLMAQFKTQKGVIFHLTLAIGIEITEGISQRSF